MVAPRVAPFPSGVAFGFPLCLLYKVLDCSSPPFLIARWHARFRGRGARRHARFRSRGARRHARFWGRGARGHADAVVVERPPLEIPVMLLFLPAFVRHVRAHVTFLFRKRRLFRSVADGPSACFFHFKTVLGTRKFRGLCFLYKNPPRRWFPPKS